MFLKTIATMGAALALVAAGCGEPGSPQPPSLNLPVPVRDLAAQRTGDVVHLTWTTPRKTTDHTTASGQVIARICRMVGSSECDRVTDERRPLGVPASYDDILPVTLTSGTSAPLTYYVELVNHAQKSAGRSNPAYALDGPAPPALTGLTVSVRAEGVVLQWEPARGCADCKVLIDRLLQGVPVRKTAGRGAGFTASPLATAAPPPRQTLEVSARNVAETIDQTAEFGQTYEYRARRVESITLERHAIELLGQESSPVRIETRDTFPPAVPKDLAAVADDRAKAIDLSWSADTERDLAGYYVYRQTPVGQGREAAVRISGVNPLPTPSFHDTDVLPGLIYAYTVSAVDQSGNESARSDEADESLATPQ
jgi:hypothetical protein